MCVANKTEGLNLSAVNMITKINEWETLIKHTSCECKWRFYRSKSNSD